MQSRVLIALTLLSAVALSGCSRKCGCKSEEETCAPSKACEEEIADLLGGCDELRFHMERNGRITLRFERPPKALNPTCTTWRENDYSTPLDLLIPYVVYPHDAPSRCNFVGAKIPYSSLKVDSYGNFYLNEDNPDPWYDFVRSHCEQASDFGSEFMELGDPCFASCVPGTLCNGSTSALYENECIACTEAPCEGFFHSAFCRTGGQLKDADLVTSIYNRLGVEMDPQTGLRQLLQEVMTCQGPFEITLSGAQSSVHFLRGIGIANLPDLGYGIEAPDRGLTWAKLRENGAETLYLCDFAETETVWQSLTLDDDGQVSNFDVLKEAWLPHCEEHAEELVQGMSAGHTCLNASTDGYPCTSGLECMTQEFLRPANTADRIGFCKPPR